MKCISMSWMNENVPMFLPRGHDALYRMWFIAKSSSVTCLTTSFVQVSMMYLWVHRMNKNNHKTKNVFYDAWISKFSLSSIYIIQFDTSIIYLWLLQFYITPLDGITCTYVLAYFQNEIIIWWKRRMRCTDILAHQGNWFSYVLSNKSNK